MGRKSKYEEYVRPNLEKIREWAASGATEQEICQALGIAVSTFNDYKNKYSELSESLRAGRQRPVLDVRAALYKRACGFKYEERRGIKKNGEIISMEVSEKYMPPDPTSIAMYLRNYDEQWRDKDAIQTEFKRQEVEIRKALAEASSFDIEF